MLPARSIAHSPSLACRVFLLNKPKPPKISCGARRQVPQFGDWCTHAHMRRVALCAVLLPWGCVATAGSCAATQGLTSPIVHDVRQCQFTDTTDGVCCYANTTGMSANFLTSCRAQQNYLDCSNACDPRASTWSLQHQSTDLGSGDLGSPRAGITMCREMCLSYWHECFSNFASSEAGDGAAYCDGVAAPEGDTDCLQMPEAHCPNQCQGFGVCDMSKDLAAPHERPAGCECYSGYLGYDCSYKVVMAEWPFGIEVPGVDISGDVVGYCSILNSTCVCTPLWFGDRCQISLIRYVAMPAITLLLLATCCNLTLTKRKMKSRTDRLMQAVSENEPVIQAAIARGFDQHEVHVCVRHFYTKNPSFVPLSEAKLLQLVKERHERHKKHPGEHRSSRLLHRSSTGWRKGGVGHERRGSMSNLLGMESRRVRKGHTQEEIEDLVEKVKHDPHDYFSAPDRRLMIQVGQSRAACTPHTTPCLPLPPSPLSDPPPPPRSRCCASASKTRRS